MFISSYTQSEKQSEKAMYHGTNTRYNLSELPVPLETSARIRIEQQAQSIACLVEKKQLIKMTQNGVIQYHIKSPTTLASQFKIQARKTYKGPFQNELSLANGTAFLVGKQLVLTAAHCICGKVEAASVRVIFGFQTLPSRDIQKVFEFKDVYRIETFWRPHCTHNNDWALLRLDREVEGRNPLSLNTSQKVALDTPLYMLGHPYGLPLKLTLGGKVQGMLPPHVFDANLDAFPGNSGSPVFAHDTGSWIGMLFKGNNDDYTSAENSQIIEDAQTSKEDIEKWGYEKCLDIASIDVLKAVLTSSFSSLQSPSFPQDSVIATEIFPLKQENFLKKDPGMIDRLRLAAVRALEPLTAMTKGIRPLFIGAGASMLAYTLTSVQVDKVWKCEKKIHHGLKISWKMREKLNYEQKKWNALMAFSVCFVICVQSKMWIKYIQPSNFNDEKKSF